MKRIAGKSLSSNVGGLPRLPIPIIEETLSRYRASVGCLKKPAQVQKHFDLLTRCTPQLSEINSSLVAADREAASSPKYPFSYIEKAWDDGYLKFRGPSPINIAPAFSFKRLPETSQSLVAAKIVNCLNRYVRKLSSEGLEFTGTDLSQMSSQFGASRVPGEDRDSFTSVELDQIRHVTVLHDGHIYLVQLVDETGALFTEESIHKAFEHILATTPTDDNPAPVSVLTATTRGDWAAAYNELLRSPENEQFLRKIQHSLVVVCLDTQSWESDVSKKQQAILHGGADESENRWYDKHQIIVARDGQVGFNFEHAFSDGMTWCRWMSDVWSSLQSGVTLTDSPAITNAPTSAVATVTPVTIALGKSFTTRLRNARQEIRALSASVQQATAVIQIGKKALKGFRMSPDAFTQMCFHLAFYTTRGKIAPTYESCSTNAFFHGRTETIRTATDDMLALIKAVSSGVEHAECRRLMHTAAARHIALAKEAAAGQGVDRHLLALHKAAEETNHELVNTFFKEDLYSYSGTWLMSTSNVSQPFLEYFCFGPVVGDGYGIGYIVDEEEIRCCISAFEGSTHTDASEMKAAVESASQALATILKA